ncbi:hypothetical protein A4X09_0g6089 [Tilletia walkeri]|uniref:Uncharacterized protein n=1 Tax=Tilletia walkeri TaxID=117179 RepID=A0A8X7T3F1_9BASI|nr:hypothetical protein A4X09_0g6089 [Tilletia walkeri]
MADSSNPWAAPSPSPSPLATEEPTWNTSEPVATQVEEAQEAAPTSPSQHEQEQEQEGHPEEEEQEQVEEQEQEQHPEEEPEEQVEETLPEDKVDTPAHLPTEEPTAPLSLEEPATAQEDDAEDDSENDDFDFQDAADPSADFDDFGDFDDVAAIEPDAAQPEAPAEPVEPDPPQSPAQQTWAALSDPRSLTQEDLVASIRSILQPTFPAQPSSPYPYHLDALTSAGAIQPASQAPIKPKSSPHARTGVLAAANPATQAVWDDLVSRPPKGYKPVSWARSGARRRLYTALGIPINLDEELPPSISGSLPPLKISLGSESSGEARPAKTRGPSTSSKPSSGRSTPQPGASSGGGSGAGPKTWRGTPQTATAPTLDLPRIEAILNLSPSQLSFLPVSALRTLAAELRTHTVSTSASLAFFLQKRDTLANDADTYNAMIRDLVAGAASRLASGGSGSRNSNGARIASGVGVGAGSPSPSPTTANAPSSGWGNRTPRSSTPLAR